MSSSDFCGCDDSLRALAPVPTPELAAAVAVIGVHCRALASEWRRSGDEGRAAAFEKVLTTVEAIR